MIIYIFKFFCLIVLVYSCSVLVKFLKSYFKAGSLDMPITDTNFSCDVYTMYTRIQVDPHIS